MKILYCDFFHKNNSNYYWLDSFKRYGQVTTVDIKINSMEALLESLEQLKSLTYDFDHIHFGGSTKKVPASIFKFIRSKTSAPITIFYGDAYNNTVNQKQVLEYVNAIYLTNGSHLSNNEKVKFIICPYDSKTFNDKNYTPSRPKDVVFIGNPYNELRAKALVELSKKINIDVYGGLGWKQYKVNYKGSVSYSDYSKTLSQYKIAIGDPALPPCEHSAIEGHCAVGQSNYYQAGLCRNTTCPSFSAMRGYFSNRLANTIASRIVHCVYHVPGIEDIFTNHKHLVWVNTQAELEKQLIYYLKDNEKREKIAKQGYDKIQHYTFDKIVDRIIEENKPK